ARRSWPPSSPRTGCPSRSTTKPIPTWRGPRRGCARWRSPAGAAELRLSLGVARFQHRRHTPPGLKHAAGEVARMGWALPPIDLAAARKARAVCAAIRAKARVGADKELAAVLGDLAGE